jgi:hypothetical protein
VRIKIFINLLLQFNQPNQPNPATHRIMKKTCIALTALSALSAGQLAQAQDIATIEAGPTGTGVTISSAPIITAIMSAPGTGDGYTYGNYAILASDGTGSVELFGHLPSGSTYVPTVGDALSVSGTYSPFSQIPEVGSLTAISAVSSGNTVPPPTAYTIPELNQTTLPLTIAGFLVELDNVTIETSSGGAISGNFPTHANGTYDVTDGVNTMTMYQWASSYASAGALGGTPIPTGPVDILGLMDVFGGTSPELIPYQISPAAAPEPSSIALAAIGGVAVLLGLRRRK